MGVKKNILYSSFLTLSNYIFGLITFPYVARILGVEHLGMVDFVTNIVAYALLFASLGITTVGIREIAKVRDNPRELNQCFSSLLVLNIVYTLVTLGVFFILLFVVDKFAEQKILFLLGALQILSTTFMLEWLFRGLEDFRFITVRNLIIKVFYVVAVLLLVRDTDDYILYFALTVMSVFINAFVNIVYSKRFVRFNPRTISFRPYFKGTVSLGAYNLLNSMYTTFNVAFLGFVADSIQVGYYTTALKVYTIVMGLFMAFTSALMPRGASLLAKGEKAEFNLLINKSFELLYTLCFPLIICCTILAPQIIDILAGPQFGGSIVPMRIVMPLLFVVGIEQILVLQVIIPAKKDNWSLIASTIGAIVGGILNIVLVTKYQAIGTSLTLLCTESFVASLYIYVVVKTKIVELQYHLILKHALCSLPYAGICLLVNAFFDGSWIVLCLSFMACGLYFVVSQLFIIKNGLVLNLLSRWRYACRKKTD